MMVEVNDHEYREHRNLMKQKEVPMEHYVNGQLLTILSIWSFKCKRFPDGVILKHKAILCAHIGMQMWGINDRETCAPVVNWISVRTLIAITKIHKLRSRSIDIVLAFPQADLNVNVYMELPIGLDGPGGGKREYVLKLKKSLYGLKKASANWF